MVTRELKRKFAPTYLKKLATFLHTYPALTLFCFTILTACFGYLALKLDHETTVRDLLPTHNQIVRNF